MTLQPLCTVHSCHLVGSNTISGKFCQLFVVCQFLAWLFALRLMSFCQTVHHHQFLHPYTSPKPHFNLFLIPTPSWHSFLVHISSVCWNVQLSTIYWTIADHTQKFYAVISVSVAIFLGFGITQVLSILSITSSTAHPLCWADLSSSLTCT